MGTRRSQGVSLMVRIRRCLTLRKVVYLVIANFLVVLLYSSYATVCFSSTYLESPSDHVLHIEEVPSTPHLTQQMYEDHIHKGIPLLITDMMSDWPALDKWTPQFFKENYGETWIDVQSSNPEGAEASYVISSTLDQYVDYIHDIEDDTADPLKWMLPKKKAEQIPPVLFYHNYVTDLFDEHDELWQDVKELGFMGHHGNPYLLESVFWMGPPGVITGLHREDDPVNILHQLYGEKRVALFPPEETPYLYKSSKYTMGAYNSPVNPFDVDLKKYPLVAKAKRFDVVVKPGQMLLIPVNWWHAVVSLDSSISLSGRTFTRCQRWSYYPQIFLNYLHNLGLYRKNDCTCHGTKEIFNGEDYAYTPAAWL